MNVHFLTIALDAMPFITFHYPVFRTLPFNWQWTIVEGVAANTNDTKWCQRLNPRLSNDGTTEYLDSLRFDPRIIVHRSEIWDGKVSMVNECLRHIRGECLLVQVDSDEVWTAEQLCKLRQLFIDNPDRNMAWFYCRYFVGRDIVITSRNNYGNNSQYEWQRAWKIEQGMRFKSHEPPIIDGLDYRPFTHAETEKHGLVFDHYAYTTEKQVELKERYYGYKDAVNHWRRLQANTVWPTNLRNFLPWVQDNAVVDKHERV